MKISSEANEVKEVAGEVRKARQALDVSETAFLTRYDIAFQKLLSWCHEKMLSNLEFGKYLLVYEPVTH